MKKSIYEIDSIKYFKELVENKKYKTIIGYCIALILIIPLTINLVAWGWSKTGFGIGAVEGWLGYWGSYLGGVLSAIGVIGTTFLILKRNDAAIETQDRKAREKEYTFYELNQIEEAHKTLVQCGHTMLKLNDLYRIVATKFLEVREYPSNRKGTIEGETEFNKLVEDYRRDMERFSDQRAIYYGLLEQFDYKMTLFSDVEEVKILKKEAANYFIKTQMLIGVLEDENFLKINKSAREKFFNNNLKEIDDNKNTYIRSEENVKGKLRAIFLGKVGEYRKMDNKH